MRTCDVDCCPVNRNNQIVFYIYELIMIFLSAICELNVLIKCKQYNNYFLDEL